MWHTFLFAAGAAPLNRFWFLFPLILIISLVYSASRYETPGKIFRRTGKLCLQITSFMAVVLAVLALLSMGL
jgi:hypothetical protein